MPLVRFPVGRRNNTANRGEALVFRQKRPDHNVGRLHRFEPTRAGKHSERAWFKCTTVNESVDGMYVALLLGVERALI